MRIKIIRTGFQVKRLKCICLFVKEIVSFRWYIHPSGKPAIAAVHGRSSIVGTIGREAPARKDSKARQRSPLFMKKKVSSRKIVHIDMDAFFAAVEQRDRPHLRGKPVIVGGTPEGRGVVSTASYEARKYGIHSAMPAVQAVKQCPHGIFLRPNFKKYKEVSDSVMEVVREFTPKVEQISLDECFLDVSRSTRLFGDAVQIALSIRTRIFECEQLTASAGVAPNKYLAKIASDLEKPDGLVIVREDEVADFLKDLPVGKIWGIGKVMEKSLNTLGIRTIGQLAELSSDFLCRRFGKHGDVLHRLARGEDERPVAPFGEAKSIGHEETYGRDVFSKEDVRKNLLRLSEAVGFRLRQNDLVCRTVTLKLRYPDFTTVTRSRTLDDEVDDDLGIFYTILELLEKTDVFRKGARLLGVHASNLGRPGTISQMTLFPLDRERVRALSKTIDEIRKRYGKEAIARARSRT